MYKIIIIIIKRISRVPIHTYKKDVFTDGKCSSVREELLVVETEESYRKFKSKK